MITFNFIKPFGEKHMKKFLFVILLGLFGQAQAAGIDAFTWTINTGLGDGTVAIDNATSSAVITGSNSGLSIVPTDTSMTTTASVAGSVSFDWTFVDNNPLSDPAAGLGGPFNFFFWIYDGVNTTLLADVTTAGSGSFGPTLINAGDVFGMSIQTQIDAFGAGIATITDFVFSPSGQGGVGEVPLPPAFLLFGVALAGLGFVQKRKQQAAV
jgi:hypothetical protein